MVSATNNDNTNYTYRYDSSNEHRLISARSTRSGIEYAYSYDDYGNITKTDMYITDADGVKPAEARSIYTETIYTTDGNYPALARNDNDVVIFSNTYDTNSDGKIIKGNVIQSVDGNGNITKYDYNINDLPIKKTIIDKNDNATELAKSVYSYADGKLVSITSGVGNDTVNYTFTYDEYGNKQGVKVGNSESYN